MDMDLLMSLGQWYSRSPITHGLCTMTFLSLAHWRGAHGLLPSARSWLGLGREDRGEAKPGYSCQ